jgi:outer membrane immunogenic protein
MKNIVIAAAFAACLATPAVAQEKTPFSGPFVGALLGYDSVRGSALGGGSESKDGLLYGGVIGYDLNLGGAVLGVEGEYTDSETKYALADDVSLNTDRDLYAGVRLGGVVAPNVMLYAKGGYSNARFEAELDGEKDGRNLDGYRLGAGVETTYRGLTGRVEYRYSNYGRFEDINVERHQVAAVIGYRF